MDAGQKNILCIHYCLTIADQQITVHTNTVIGFTQAAEPAGLAVAGKTGSNGIICVQDQGIRSSLVGEEAMESL